MTSEGERKYYFCHFCNKKKWGEKRKNKGSREVQEVSFKQRSIDKKKLVLNQLVSILN
jgi:hypothetical protein